MIYNKVSIADWANLGLDINDESFFKETLKKSLPTVTGSPVDPLYNFRRDYLQSDGSRSRFFVVIPFTTALQNQLIEKKNDEREAQAADVEIFAENSEMTNADAKEYAYANHYKTPIDSTNHYRDTNTGRVTLFEKQWFTPRY